MCQHGSTALKLTLNHIESVKQRGQRNLYHHLSKIISIRFPEAENPIFLAKVPKQKQQTSTDCTRESNQKFPNRPARMGKTRTVCMHACGSCDSMICFPTYPGVWMCPLESFGLICNACEDCACDRFRLRESLEGPLLRGFSLYAAHFWDLLFIFCWCSVFSRLILFSLHYLGLPEFFILSMSLLFLCLPTATIK